MKKNAKTDRIMKATCSKCKNVFGLDTNFVEDHAEINMRYSCPYCKKPLTLCWG